MPLPPTLRVSLDHVASQPCGIIFPMVLQDDTQGQAWYAVEDPGEPYGECFQASDGNGGWTWQVYLVVASGQFQGTYTMPRAVAADDPTGVYAGNNSGATAEEGV